MCWFPIYCGADYVIRVGGPLGVKERMLPSLSWGSTVNLMWVSIWFIWLNRISTWSFLIMQITSSTYLFHQGVRMGHRVPVLTPQNIPYIYWLLLEKLVNPWQLLGVVCRTSVENTQLFSTTSRSVMSLSFGMLWECSKKSCIPSCEMCSVNFLLMTSRATGTAMLVNKVFTSKESNVSSLLMPFPLKLSASPLLSLTKEKFLPVYLCNIFVRNFDNL